MSILSGPAIRAAVARGDIVIDPYRVEHVNPASIDLTLGRTCGMYVIDRAWPNGVVVTVLDSKKDNEFVKVEEDSFVLKPGNLYLLHTAERIRTDCFVPVIDGKSFIGRLGVCIHQTAGYGDPGYDGQYTLEVTAVYPTRLYAGMRIAQMRFHELVEESVDDGGEYVIHDKQLYRGNYTGAASMGPVPSRSWKQFDMPPVSHEDSLGRFPDRGDALLEIPEDEGGNRGGT